MAAKATRGDAYEGEPFLGFLVFAIGAFFIVLVLEVVTFFANARRERS